MDVCQRIIDSTIEGMGITTDVEGKVREVLAAVLPELKKVNKRLLIINHHLIKENERVGGIQDERLRLVEAENESLRVQVRDLRQRLGDIYEEAFDAARAAERIDGVMAFLIAKDYIQSGPMADYLTSQMEHVLSICCDLESRAEL